MQIFYTCSGNLVDWTGNWTQTRHVTHSERVMSSRWCCDAFKTASDRLNANKQQGAGLLFWQVLLQCSDVEVSCDHERTTEGNFISSLLFILIPNFQSAQMFEEF